ncbi:MAG TPA: helix-turn-helix domain-containing protein [Novosphingobium sp.]|mgnify:CR=1 FL=1|nr:helix-turn-helix domain-containing protein [Novosphingobium sp.]
MADEVTEEAQLPLDNVGARLRRAREAKGMSLAQVAAKTRIPERLLAAIEQGNFSALPARTYAVGFSRSYAKAVGLNDLEIAEAVRGELAEQYVEPPRRPPAFEPGDPARVPPGRLAWLAALGALALLIAGLFFWRSYFLPGGELPSILPQETAAPAAGAEAQAPQPPQPPASGPVVFTATADGVWVKFYDGAGVQLLQKQMAMGETWTVPADAAGVRIWTARPDQLTITIGGQPVPPLSDVQRTIKDVPVDAASLLARGAAPAATGGQVGAAPAPVAAQPAGLATAPGGPAPQARSAPAAARAPAPAPSPVRVPVGVAAPAPQPVRSSAPLVPAPASAPVESDPGAATIQL